MSRPTALAGALLLLLATTPPARAQQIRTALAPDTATVGTVVQVALRLEVPAETRVEVPDTLPIADPLESLERARVTTEEAPGGARVTVVYALTGWRPGEHALPPVSVRLRGPGGERTLDAPLPALVIRSVLPADTAGIEPRPAASVVGPSRVLWPWIVAAALLLLALAALGYWLWRRRARRPRAAGPARSPRESAAAALDELARSGLLEAGDLKAFYSGLSEALRRFLAAQEPGWGVDLSTTELRERVGIAGAAGEAGPVLPILERADLVKFARARPRTEEARAELARAREWVERFAWPPAPAPAAPAGAQEAA